MTPDQMIFAVAIGFTVLTLTAYQVKIGHDRFRRATDRAEDFRHDAAEQLRQHQDRLSAWAEADLGHRGVPVSSAPIGVRNVVPHCGYCGGGREPGKTSCRGCGAPVEEVLPPLLTLEPMLDLYNKGIVSRHTVLEELDFGAMEKLS